MKFRTWLLLAMVLAAPPGLGCSTRRSAPEPKPSQEWSSSKVDASLAPAPASTSAAVGEKPSVRNFTNARPPELARVRRDTVVLQLGLQGARLKGPVELLNRPDDTDPTYLARRRVDEAALPQALREKRGVEVTLLTPTPTSDATREVLDRCNARLGSISAYAWADESQPWESLGKQAILQKTFNEGTRYLAAELLEEACPLRMWAMFSSGTNVRFWHVEPASDEVRSRAVRALRDLPERAAAQSEYDAFRRKLERINADVEKLRSEDALAQGRLAWFKPSALQANFFDLPGDTALWMVLDEAGPGLLVGLFERHVAETVPNTAHRGQGEETLLFETTLLVVWKYGAEIESVISSLSTKKELDGFNLRGGVSSADGLPALLFNAYYVNGVLRPIDGKYAVDESLMLRPSEPKASTVRKP
jgi:hypothetical protein